MLFSFGSPRVVRYFPTSVRQGIHSSTQPWQLSSILSEDVFSHCAPSLNLFATISWEALLKECLKLVAGFKKKGLTQIIQYGGEKERFLPSLLQWAWGKWSCVLPSQRTPMPLTISMPKQWRCKKGEVKGGGNLRQYSVWISPVSNCTFEQASEVMKKPHDLNAYSSVHASGKDCNLLLFSQ